MDFISWKDDYSVRNPIIDEQHKNILNMINLINSAILQNRTQDVVEVLIQDMMEYALHHFETEEKLMKENKYPKLEEHQREHQIYMSRTNDLFYLLQTSNENTGKEILSFLKQWWKVHILEEDREYIPWLRKQL